MPSADQVLERLGPLVTERVDVEHLTFFIQKPSQTDEPLEDLPDYIPFWADLWPAARMLAKVILRESWAPGTEALELGCGLGLPGIVALSRGTKVTFSDLDHCALHFAADNARRNGFDDFRTLLLDWRAPPTDLKFPVIFGADLIYEQSHAELLAGVIRQMLAPGGTCWLTDLERLPGRGLHQALTDADLHWTRQTVRAGEPGGRRYKGTLYRIGAK